MKNRYSTVLKSYWYKDKLITDAAAGPLYIHEFDRFPNLSIMEHDIIEVPYSDNVAASVITIDLPHPPHVQDEQVSQTILYTQDGHTMTTLQPNQIGTLPIEVDQADNKNSVELINTDPHSSDVIITNNIESSTNNTDGGDLTGSNGHRVRENYISGSSNNSSLDNSNILPHDGDHTLKSDQSDENNSSTCNGSKSMTRFKWTKEKSQVAMNLVKYGCKPKLVSVAVGCSLRTAQKFVETVTPKMEGGPFKNYEIRRRGRKSKDVNQRLNAIREVLSRDSTKTQVEIAADLKVSNTTVCRDLKRMGATWGDKNKESSADESNGQRGREQKKDKLTNNTRKGTTTKSRSRARQKKVSPKKEAEQSANLVSTTDD